MLNFLMSFVFHEVFYSKNVDSCTPKYCKYPYTKRQSNKHTMCEYCGLGKLCGTKICQYGLTEVSISNSLFP